MLLFADGICRASPSGFLARVIANVTIVFREPTAQWMGILCLACNFLTFAILERGSWPQERRRYVNIGHLLLFTLVALVLLRYAMAYQNASHSTQVPVFLAGIIFGKAIPRLVQGRTGQVHQCLDLLVNLLIFVLLCAAFWQPDLTLGTQYQDVFRWGGNWENPNTYGLLMGTGLVLATGQFLRVGASKKEDIIWGKLFCITIYFSSLSICAYGLFKSYSRGAWIGTGGGLTYLLWSQCFSSDCRHGSKSPYKWSGWLCRNRTSLAILIISLTLLMFWQFRFTEFRPAQRLFSMVNTKDFSWRNRVAVWNGAIHMMVDRPLIGFGWGQAEEIFQKSYLPFQLNEGGAIETNDYFMLSISSGAPALFFFAAYIFYALKRKKSAGEIGIHQEDSLFATCRSGSIVLLTGFWFDGGLFTLSVASIFWILLELSFLEKSLPFSVSEFHESAGTLSNKDIWLRRVAWLLIAVALLQTAVYLITPFLRINNKTLAMARKCLIPQKEIDDFDFLSSQPVWRGRTLKILLEHVDLANYNRQLVNWKLDNQFYREYVLTPTIQPGRDGQLLWRSLFWEYFYPRIRKETDPVAVTQIIVRQLHRRLTTSLKGSFSIEEMWRQQTADAAGFEVLCVAAFRSVGIAARLSVDGQAEFYNKGQWQSTRSPALSRP